MLSDSTDAGLGDGPVHLLARHQPVKIKKLETHTNQSNLPIIYQAGYKLKIAKFSDKLNQLKHSKQIVIPGKNTTYEKYL